MWRDGLKTALGYRVSDGSKYPLGACPWDLHTQIAFILWEYTMEPAACPYNRPCAENNDNNDTHGHSRGDNNANRESLYS